MYLKKIELIVLDLDGTLINYDSFNKLVKMHIFHPFVMILTMMRKLRIIDSYKFKCYIVSYLINKGWNPNHYAKQIIKGFQSDIMQKIEKNISNSSKIILLSASPNIYVSEIANQMGWIGYGTSTLENKKDPQLHLHGQNKLLFIQKNYPKELYFYKYAIADSKTDLPLLEQFKNYELLK